MKKINLIDIEAQPDGDAVGADDAMLSAFAIDEPETDWLNRLRRAEGVGPLERMGSFELLAEVSRGGQGVVYQARHADTKHPIALKRLHLDAPVGSAARGRFERELETAASLQHDGIVKVLGMELSEGRPLLAMEWIDGVPIDRWAKSSPAAPDGEHELGAGRSVADRLALFMLVCDAVSHAHQRGVIHRDIKPSNILVDAHNRPHVLDFGLAKFTGKGEAAARELTKTTEFVGTLAYASPEQLSGKPDTIDVRSDVYGLGVILYQMLTGRLPHAGAPASAAEALAAIDSRAVATPSSINDNIDRELDVIVLKAMAREPDRRYQSVDALRADLARHMAGEPILARPPGTWYLLRTLIQRHRVGFGFAVTIALLVLAGGITAAVLATNLAQAQNREHQARGVAEEINTFLNQMLQSADPAHASGPNLSVRELLDRAADRLEREDDLADQPLVRAALHHTIGGAYHSLGVYQAASDHLERGLELRRRNLHGDQDELAMSMSAIAALRYSQGRLEEAEDLSRQALEMLRRGHEGDHVAIAQELNNLGAILRAQNQLQEAEDLLQQALDMRVRLLDENDPQVAETLTNLGGVRRAKGDLPGVEPLIRRALEIRRNHFGEQHVMVAQGMDNLGILLVGLNRLEEAETFLRQARAVYIDLLGPDHPDVGISAMNLGQLLMRKGEPAAAEPLLREGLRSREAVLPATDARVPRCKILLASCLLQLGRMEESEALAQEAYGLVQNAPGADPTEVIQFLVKLYEEWDEPEKAAEYRALLPPPLAPPATPNR